jgi:hypothetical protein
LKVSENSPRISLLKTTLNYSFSSRSRLYSLTLKSKALENGVEFSSN